MNPRIKKIEQEIDKLKGKVASYQTRCRELVSRSANWRTQRSSAWCGAWMFRRMSWRRCFVRFAAAHRCRRTI